MAIKAVVFDIGSVLERVDDTLWPGPWESRLGLAAGGFFEAVANHDLGGDVTLGEVSEAELREAWKVVFDIDDETADELMRDMWDWYCGELDTELLDYFVGLRSSYKTGILSNSGDGARREEQRRYGFADLTDTIVYSHEVGLMKPDPRIYELTCQRLDVRPDEVVFLDDVQANVDGARRAGWQAILHENTSASITAVNEILGRSGVAGDW